VSFNCEYLCMVLNPDGGQIVMSPIPMGAHDDNDNVPIIEHFAQSQKIQLKIWSEGRMIHLHSSLFTELGMKDPQIYSLDSSVNKLCC
jgi:hypothetical protein